MQINSVALAHDPDVSLEDAAVLFPTIIEHDDPAADPSWVQPLGIDGTVLDPSRKAAIRRRSPAWCDGIVTVVPDADPVPISDAAM